MFSPLDIFFLSVRQAKGDKGRFYGDSSDRQVPRKARFVGGVKGHNINETSFPGSPALWAGSFIPSLSKLTFSKR